MKIIEPKILKILTEKLEFIISLNKEKANK